jgi:hypothetical protein
MWGNKELRFLSGTSVSTGGATGVTVTGVGTSFLTEVENKQLLTVGAIKAEVTKVNSDTSLTVSSPIFVSSGSTGFYVTELPKYLSEDEKLTKTFGVDSDIEMPLTPGPQHAGWVTVKQQSGYVKEVVLNTTGATGYDPDAPPTVSFSGTGGASGVAIVSPEGAVTEVTVTNPGVYTNVAPTVTIGATGATGVVGSVVMGGRFGRKLYETIVAMGVPQDVMNDAEDTEFPNS